MITSSIWWILKEDQEDLVEMSVIYGGANQSSGPIRWAELWRSALWPGLVKRKLSYSQVVHFQSVLAVFKI